MKKRNLVFVALVMISAGIFFSDLESTYNFGDMISLEITVDPISEGYLVKTYLFCGGNKILEFNNLPDSGGEVDVLLPLNLHTLNEISGNCYFTSGYSDNSRTSSEFEISKRLNVELYSNSYFVYPGEEVIISGRAERLNNAVVNGEVEISIPLLKALEIVVDETNDENNEESESDDGDSTESDDEESEEDSEVTDEEIVDEIEGTENAGIYYGQVIEGEYSVSFKLKEVTPAGDYRVDVLVFEDVSGIRASEGAVIANLKVFQVLKDIELVLSNQNIDPGNRVEFKPKLLDQTGLRIDEEVSVIIRDEELIRIYEKIVKSDETVGYDIPTELVSGYYEIEARNGEFNSFQTFYVNEKAIVSFELSNDSLFVENVGNIPYNKDIEIELSGKSFVKKINLEMGEIQELKLAGSNEEYNVKISDGETEFSQGGVMLTGNAVNVNAVGDGLRYIGKPIVWIFFIIILGAGGLFLFRNIFKKKSFAKFTDKLKRNKNNVGEDGFKKESDFNKLPSHDKAKVVNQIGKSVKEDGKSDLKGEKNKDTPEDKKDLGNGGIAGKIEDGSWDKSGSSVSKLNQAEQVLVMQGHKSKATAIVLKIKNKISDHSKKSLEKAIEHVYNKKGAVYEQGDFIFIIFSPLLTKTNKNVVDAAKAAELISLVLKEHNKKFDEKIDFGIGINSGEVINKVDSKKLKFTAMGNFIVVAKRLAESSDKQILITKESFENGNNEIKADKVGDGEVYKVRNVVDSEKNKKFIKGFLERMEKEEGES